MGTMIDYTRPDGQTVQGFLAVAEQPRAAIVVVQEWWGLNAQIRGVAERLARAGFTALVPDLYRGQSTVEAAEAQHLMTDLNFADAASQDLRGAVQYLKALPPEQRGASGKVGVTGFCMGGALTVLSTCHVPELDAAVVWYGNPPVEYVDASKIRAPILAHWALQDAFFRLDFIDDLEAKLREAGVRYTGHRYLAHHAFANEEAQGPGRLPQTQYDAAWAQVAWDRTLAFLGAELG